MSIEKHLSRPAVTIREDASIRDAAHAMRDEAAGCLVVVGEDGRAVGVLTDRDLALRVVGRSCDPADLRVRDAMSTDLVTVEKDEDPERVIHRMKARGVRRVPVVEDGKPIALIALDDILQVLARELHDLGTEARQRYRHAATQVRYEHLREGTERQLEELGHRLAFANWFAKQSFVEELDDLRERLRKAIGRE